MNKHASKDATVVILFKTTFSFLWKFYIFVFAFQLSLLKHATSVAFRLTKTLCLWCILKLLGVSRYLEQVSLFLLRPGFALHGLQLTIFADIWQQRLQHRRTRRYPRERQIQIKEEQTEAEEESNQRTIIQHHLNHPHWRSHRRNDKWRSEK